MKPIQRLEQFRKAIKISLVDFEKSIGYKTNAYANAISRKSSLKDETISLIMRVYPELNIQWLFLGSGSMVKGESEFDKGSFEEPNLYFVYELMEKIDPDNQHLKHSSKLKNEVVKLYSLYSELRNEFQKIKKLSEKL